MAHDTDAHGGGKVIYMKLALFGAKRDLSAASTPELVVWFGNCAVALASSRRREVLFHVEPAAQPPDRRANFH